MKLFEVREQRALKVAEMRALADGEMTADKKNAFDKLKGEVVTREQDEQRAQDLEEAERRAMGRPADKQAAQLESRISVLDAINAQIEGRALNGALGEFNAEQKRMGVQAKGVLIPHSLFE